MHFLIHRVVRSFTGAAVLCIVTFNGEALAQTHDQLGTKASKVLAQATQPQSAQAQPGQSIWGVTCAGTASGLDCRAIQALRMTNTGQLTVAVRVPPDTKKPVMLLLAPLGIYLPGGVMIQFGQEAAKTAPLNTCDGAGCLAEYVITDAEVASMVKGQAVTVSVQDANKRSVTVQVPSTGFAAAYAKIK